MTRGADNNVITMTLSRSSVTTDTRGDTSASGAQETALGTKTSIRRFPSRSLHCPVIFNLPNVECGKYFSIGADVGR